MRMTRTTKQLELLTAHGIKSSPARLLVLSACMISNIPLDVSQVYEKLGGKVHLATVYRTLEKFVALGLLERIDFQEGKFRYEYLHSHHHHAVCESCGKVEDIVDTQTQVKSLEKSLALNSGFSVTKHILELFGICNNCQKKGIYA